MAQDPFGQQRKRRRFDLGLKATGLLTRRRVWIALWLVFGALAIVGILTSTEELPPA